MVKWLFLVIALGIGAFGWWLDKGAGVACPPLFFFIGGLYSVVLVIFWDRCFTK